MVPLRAVFEAMRAKVGWDNANQRVTSTYTKDGRTVILQLTIGSPFIQRTISDTYGNTRTLVQKLDTPPQIVNGSTFIPLRASGESLGSEVKWDASTQTASLKYVDILGLEQSFLEYKVIGSIWDLEKEELESFFATNQLRKLAGTMNPVTLSVDLTKIARTKSKDGYDHNSGEHTSVTLGTPEEMLVKAKYPFDSMGENLARGYYKGADVVEGWHHSPTHFENIKEESYDTVGIGLYKGWWAQEFVTSATPAYFKSYQDRVALSNGYEAKISVAKTDKEKQQLEKDRDNALFQFDAKANEVYAKSRELGNIFFFDFVSKKFPGKFTIYEDKELDEGYQYYINHEVVLTQNYLPIKGRIELKIAPSGINNSSVMGLVKDIVSKNQMISMTTFDNDLKAALATDGSWFYRTYSGERIEYEYSGTMLYIRFNFAYPAGAEIVK